MVETEERKGETAAEEVGSYFLEKNTGKRARKAEIRGQRKVESSILACKMRFPRGTILL